MKPNLVSLPFSLPRSAYWRFLPLAALALQFPFAAHADKVYFKNGKFLDGDIKDELPTYIEFINQGRVMRIPRERIDRIEKEMGVSVSSLIARAEDSLAAGKVEDAETALSKAQGIDGSKGPNAAALKEIEDKIKVERSKGSSAERRKKAEKLLKEAVENFDKIQTQQGTELLIASLNSDPTYEAAHDEMSKFLKTSVPDLSLAADYFCDMVDSEKIKGDHAVIDLLPQIFVLETEKLQATKDQGEVKKRVGRLKKLSAAFDAHPAWAAKANPAQKELIDLRGTGVVSRQVLNALEDGNYAEAMARLQPLGGEKDSPELTDLYIRVNLGLKEFDKAKELLESTKAAAPDPAVVDKTISAVDLYRKAIEASEAGNNKDARGMLNVLFEQRKELSPEINRLVADAKVGYDLSAMENLEGSDDLVGAANLAAQIYGYSHDRAALKTVEESFSRYAPQLPYAFKAEWKIDDMDIPFPPEWIEGVKTTLTEKFDIKLADDSPFVFTLRILEKTIDQAGPRIKSSLQQPDPYAIDYIEPDTSVTGLTLEFNVSHPSDPDMYTLKHEWTTLPPPVLAAREAAKDDRHKKGTLVFHDLPQLAAVRGFLEQNLAHYLPPDLAVMGTRIKLEKPH